MVDLVLDETELPELSPVLDREAVLELQSAVRGVFLEAQVVRYAIALVAATRAPAEHGLDLERYVELGASPRASLALARAARALALIEGDDAATPDHVKAMAPAVLRHRLVPSYLADAERITADAMIRDILDSVPVP